MTQDVISMSDSFNDKNTSVIFYESTKILGRNLDCLNKRCLYFRYDSNERETVL